MVRKGAVVKLHTLASESVLRVQIRPGCSQQAMHGHGPISTLTYRQVLYPGRDLSFAFVMHSPAVL